MADADGFLSRWSRRKVQTQRGLPVADASPPPAPLAPAAAAVAAPAPAATAAADAAPPAPPPPTMDEVDALTPQSPDFSRFVAPRVDPKVRNAALKKLFADPHFNVMDGLDTYIDDYGKPDPLPAGMLRQMVQSQSLGLFADEDEVAEKTPTADPPPAALAAAPSHPALPPGTPTDEDPDLRLQPDDGAGRAGAEPGAGEDAGRQP